MDPVRDQRGPTQRRRHLSTSATRSDRRRTEIGGIPSKHGVHAPARLRKRSHLSTVRGSSRGSERRVSCGPGTSTDRDPVPAPAESSHTDVQSVLTNSAPGFSGKSPSERRVAWKGSGQPLLSFPCTYVVSFLPRHRQAQRWNSRWTRSFLIGSGLAFG